MLIDDFNAAVSSATEAQLRTALKQLLAPHATPVFGAAKTIVHEVAALNALQELGRISSNPDEYDLIEKLRITKSKARALLYQAGLRSEINESEINAALCKALATTQAIKEGQLYLIEVPDPLTMDRLRKRVHSYGYLTDGSFSGSVAKIPEGALIKLVDELMPKKQKDEITKQLIEAGMPDKSIAGLIKAILAQAGKKVAGELGDSAGNVVGDVISDTFAHGWQTLKNYVSDK